jgi:hypothetical protein
MALSMSCMKNTIDDGLRSCRVGLSETMPRLLGCGSDGVCSTRASEGGDTWILRHHRLRSSPTLRS